MTNNFDCYFLAERYHRALGEIYRTHTASPDQGTSRKAPICCPIRASSSAASSFSSRASNGAAKSPGASRESAHSAHAHREAAGDPSRNSASWPLNPAMKCLRSSQRDLALGKTAGRTRRQRRGSNLLTSPPKHQKRLNLESRNTSQVAQKCSCIDQWRFLTCAHS